MESLKTSLKDRIIWANQRIKEGRLEEAASELKNLIIHFPESAELSHLLCNLYLTMDEAEIPGKWMQNAMSFDPDFGHAVIERASRLYEEDRFKECESLLNTLVKCDSGNPEAWNDLGTVRFSLKNFDGSMEAFGRALELNPSYSKAILNLAALYVATNRPELAVKTAWRVVEAPCEVTPELLRELAGFIHHVAPAQARLLIRKAGELASGMPDREPAYPQKDAAAREDVHLFNPDLNKKAVVWYCTMKCNNHCPYCLAFQVNDPMIQVPFRDYREWVDAWNRFEGELLLDITGGEPFLLPNLIELINELKSTTRVAVTTNAKCDLTRFVQEVSPEKCVSITASLHPSTTMNTEHFLGKIQLLKQRGFRVTVNYVAYPEQLWMIPYFKEQVEACGIPFHVDPYGPGPKRPYKLSEQEEAFLRRYVGMDRGDFFNKEPVLYRCSGGMDFFSVLPNGDTYTCVTKRYVKENRVGNLFDENFKPFDEPIACKAISCAGCDLDKATRIRADQVRFP